MLGWPKRPKLAYAFLWEYSYKRLELAQLLGQLGVFLTLSIVPSFVVTTAEACTKAKMNCQKAMVAHFTCILKVSNGYCPNQEPPFLAVMHPARPHKSPLQKQIHGGKHYGRLTTQGGPGPCRRSSGRARTAWRGRPACMRGGLRDPGRCRPAVAMGGRVIKCQPPSARAQRYIRSDHCD